MSEEQKQASKRMIGIHRELADECEDPNSLTVRFHKERIAYLKSKLKGM